MEVWIFNNKDLVSLVDNFGVITQEDVLPIRSISKYLGVNCNNSLSSLSNGPGKIKIHTHTHREYTDKTAKC